MARSFSAIPLVHLPQGYELHTGSILTDFYEQHGPIFRTDSYGTPTVFLVGPEANRFVMTTDRLKFSHHIGWGRFFDVEYMFGNGLLTMDGDEHAKNRRMMNPAFTVNYMDRYLPIMNRIIREHLAAWREAGTVDVYDAARKLTFAVAAEALAGMRPGREVDRYRELYTAMLFGGAGTPSQDAWMMHISSIRDELGRLLHKKIAERRANPTDDILGMMVRAQDDDGSTLTNAQIIAHTNILLVAGHETSTSLVAWLLYLLTQHPAYAARVIDEQDALLGRDDDPTLDQIKSMKALHYALQEAERLYPPVPNGPRGVVEDFVFSDYHVPAGVFAFYSIIASHHNPRFFPNPDRFDPDRFAPPREEDKKNPYSLVGFGGGPRICIGINFAQVEIKALVSHLVRRLRLELVPGQNIRQVYGATGFPMEGIRMTVKARDTRATLNAQHSTR
jgi:cytochrome P450